MGATITYKNNTIATIANGNTATLNTQAKWMEDNVSISVDSLNLQTKTVTPNATTQIITADANSYDGLSQVTISGDSYLVPQNIRKNITIFGVTGTCENNTVTVTDTIDVNEGIIRNITTSSDPIFLQEKIGIEPGATAITVQPDTGYDGLTSVQINAIPTMTLPTSAASSATSGYTSKAVINRSTAAQYINIPTGYNSSGIYYTINAVPNGSASGPSTVSGTSATVSTGTNTLTLTKTVSITPTVSAGYVSSGTATNASVSLTASVTTKATATITPGTSNQTIAAGTYITGTQTIAGDADLVASNIISTANIFGVQGSVVINKYYTGSNAPAASLGSNGDIYLQE